MAQSKYKPLVYFMTDNELERRFPTEEEAVQHFLNIRYGGAITCPHCGQPVTYRYHDGRLKAFHCYHCHNSFSPFADTIFRKTHLDLRVWFKAISFIINGREGVSSLQLARHLGVAVTTGWRIFHQIRKAMGNDQMRTLFEAVVEVDETYVGGKPRKGNAILDAEGKVVAHSKPKVKRGRGTKKTPVVGVKERDTSHVYAKVMLPDDEGKKLTGPQLLEVLRQGCKNGCTVISDDFSGYNILDKEHGNNFIHLTVKHSLGQYCTKDGIHTNGIENFWGVFKRGIIGTYYHVSVKYMQRYLDEFCFRQNTRKEPRAFDILLSQCVLPPMA
jgi:transposase-like protein